MDASAWTRPLAALALFCAIAGSAAAQERRCEAADPARCAVSEMRCLRDCSDLTACVRRCCEARLACLVARGCALPETGCSR